MINAKCLIAAGAALLMTAAMAAGAAAPAARAAERQLCRFNLARVVGGYVIQNNEWGSTAVECLITPGNATFAVERSAIAVTGGAPGGYPSVYAGCHWGLCGSGGLASAPPRVAALPPGRLFTYLAVAERAHPGSVYDVAYDIWIGRSPRTGGEPDGAEIMIWLDHQGRPARPAGSSPAASRSAAVSTTCGTPAAGRPGAPSPMS